jgi:hypothetical protein
MEVQILVLAVPRVASTHNHLIGRNKRRNIIEWHATCCAFFAGQGVVAA